MILVACQLGSADWFRDSDDDQYNSCYLHVNNNYYYEISNSFEENQIASLLLHLTDLWNSTPSNPGRKTVSLESRWLCFFLHVFCCFLSVQLENVENKYNADEQAAVQHFEVNSMFKICHSFNFWKISTSWSVSSKNLLSTAISGCAYL